MRAALAPALIFAFLTACSVEQQEGEAEVTEDIAPLDDREDTPVRVTSTDGSSVSVARRDGNQAQWPKGFDAYPGAVVTRDIAMGGSEDSARMIEFETADAAQDVVDFYREKARAAGYEIQLDLKVNEGRMITGEREDGTGFSVSTRRSGDANRVSLTAGHTR